MKDVAVSQIKMRHGVSYLSVEECSLLLNVSKSTVYQMLRDGRIEGAFRINRSWRIPVVEPKIRAIENYDKKSNDKGTRA